MKKLSLATAIAIALIGTARAGTYTYLCRDHHKAYPVTLNDGRDEDCSGATTSCTITWRGTTFRNVKLVEGCRARYLTTQNGVTLDLCTMTKGGASLKIGNAPELDCQMP